MKRAVFPGTFDPITVGHEDIIRRALPLFDELIIAIGVNAGKKTLFSLEERTEFISTIFKEESQIRVLSYSGLTAHFCEREDASYIVRGLRNTTDLNYEQPIAQTNFKMAQKDSIFLLSSPEVSHISSTIARDVLINHGDFSTLLHPAIHDKVLKALADR